MNSEQAEARAALVRAEEAARAAQQTVEEARRTFAQVTSPDLAFLNLQWDEKNKEWHAEDSFGHDAAGFAVTTRTVISQNKDGTWQARLSVDQLFQCPETSLPGNTPLEALRAATRAMHFVLNATRDHMVQVAHALDARLTDAQLDTILAKEDAPNGR